MDLTQMTVIELKAMAYDCIAQQEFVQRQLQAINAEIVSRGKENKDGDT